jgi:hypothetical protein
MNFERCVPDPVMLAPLMADLDTPMDEHRIKISFVSIVFGSHDKKRTLKY